MPILSDSRFSRILPLKMFEQLHNLLQQMRLKLGKEAVLLTENVSESKTIAQTSQMQQFTVVISQQFNVLLLGEPQAFKSPDEFNRELTPYKVGLSFDLKAIASFLAQSNHKIEDDSLIMNLLKTAQPNEATLQSEFTLSLIELLSGDFTHNSESIQAISTNFSTCQPFVEKALHQQVEQERLLHQVTTQIRQSLELPVILKIAVEQVRDFLQVDRLLIYQFDDVDCPEKNSDNTSVTDKKHSSNLQTSPALPPSSELRWGCVTYEARVSEDISSVLNLMEEEDGFTHIPNCREKYRLGITFAIDDTKIAYKNFPCLLELMQRTQVRAKLVAPIVVQGNLWGLLIAHKCFEKRPWKDSEKMFLKQIADHLTVAIYQAQLYAQLQQQKNILEQRVIERTQELRDTLQAAQAANHAKSEFLAAMSHELRTPLTCVIGMSATLLRWSFGQEGQKIVPIHKQRSYLKMIQESGEHLLELINDILDFSQVEAGKAVLNISQFSLSQLTHQTLRTLQEKALLQKVKLEMNFQVEQQDDLFFADSRRVRQILFNLLGNAIKFTPFGGKVTLRVWREQNLAVFQIEDTGIGIADHQLPLLFQKFQQLETTYQRNYEGTGLGLALTKQLVELHGGRITVESVVGEGSLFTVWLPNQPIAISSTSKVTTKQNNNFQPQGSIVLVEDQEENAAAICEILTASSYQVIWLMNGSTAVEQIELLQPNAVILAWQLAGLDSYEITHNLRSSPTTQHIKILALATSPISEKYEQVLCAEVDDYLHKPIEPIQLINKITALIEN